MSRDEVLYRLTELERMVRNVVRFVEVDEVDARKGLARGTDRGGGEGKDLPLPMLPWGEVGAPRGDKKSTTWRPPAQGSRMMVLSPSGRLDEGMMFHAQYSDKAHAPSDDGNEHVEEFGKTRVTWRDDKAVIENGGARITVVDGRITIEADVVEIKGHVKVQGDIEHTGSITTTGVHRDARGFHK